MITEFSSYNEEFLEEPKIITNSKNIKWSRKSHARIFDYLSGEEFYYEKASYIWDVTGKLKKMLKTVINDHSSFEPHNTKFPSCIIGSDYEISIFDDYIEYDYWEVDKGEIMYTKELKDLSDKAKEIIILKRDGGKFGL